MSLYKRCRYRDESNSKNAVRTGILSVLVGSGMDIPGQVSEPCIVNVADSSEGSRLLGVVQHHRILTSAESLMTVSKNNFRFGSAFTFFVPVLIRVKFSFNL